MSPALDMGRVRAHSPLARRAGHVQANHARRQEAALRLAQWQHYRSNIHAWAHDCVQIQISDDDAGAPWIPLRLWPAQVELLEQMRTKRRLLVLKARQLGMTWLALVRVLHEVVFTPGSKALLLSLRETEAIAALRRLAGMYRRLPAWQKAEKALRGLDSGGTLTLSTGSEVVALPSHRGDSYTPRIVVVDEASLIPGLASLLGSVEPTVGDQGQIMLISRANKQDPSGTFARLCEQALGGGSSWHVAFLPWHARPDRDEAWYARQRQASLDVDGTLDTLHGQYPSTPYEALAPSTGDRRIPAAWLAPCVEITTARRRLGSGVEIFREPDPNRRYVIGADPAQGLESGDDSALCVLDADTGEEVAAGCAKWEPKHVFPEVLREVSELYFGAPILVEVNNHGHAVIGALQSLGVDLLLGLGSSPGFEKSPSSKARLWTDVVGEVQARAQLRSAEGFADAAWEDQDPAPPLIRSARTASQAGLLEAATCKAPAGEHDDAADAWGLAQWARQRPRPAKAGGLRRQGPPRPTRTDRI